MCSKLQCMGLVVSTLSNKKWPWAWWHCPSWHLWGGWVPTDSKARRLSDHTGQPQWQTDPFPGVTLGRDKLSHELSSLNSLHSYGENVCADSVCIPVYAYSASWQMNLAVFLSLGAFITIPVTSGNQIPGRSVCVFIPRVLGRSAKLQITASSQQKGLSSGERPCDFRCADDTFSPSLSLPAIQEARWLDRSPLACQQHSWRAAAKNFRIMMNMAFTLDCVWGVRLKKFPLGRLYQ